MRRLLLNLRRKRRYEMTEKEVKAMEAKVSSTAIDPEFEAAWLNEQLETLTVQEKRVACAWKFQKLMRNDDQMKTAFDDLTKIRSGLTIVREQLAALGKSA